MKRATTKQIKTMVLRKERRKQNRSQKRTMKISKKLKTKKKIPMPKQAKRGRSRPQKLTKMLKSKTQAKKRKHPAAAPRNQTLQRARRNKNPNKEEVAKAAPTASVHALEAQPSENVDKRG